MEVKVFLANKETTRILENEEEEDRSFLSSSLILSPSFVEV